jgi:hypothetical protein
MVETVLAVDPSAESETLIEKGAVPDVIALQNPLVEYTTGLLKAVDNISDFGHEKDYMD